MAWIEDTTKRKAKEKHYYDSANPARHQAVLTVHDQHYQNNGWQDVDETIVDDTSITGYIAKADKQQHAVYFGSAGERRWYPRRDVATEYVTAGKPDYWTGSRWRAWILTGLTRAANAVTWETADYRVSITNTWGAVKLLYMLKTSAAPARIRFPLTLTGLTFDGRQFFSGGAVVGLMEPPGAEDASGAEVAISGGYAGGYYEINLTGAGAYPITIDPTFTDGPSGDVTTSKDNTLRSGNPYYNYNYGSYGNGYLSTSRFTLIQFDLSSIRATATCDSATLYLYNGSTGQNQTMSVYAIASGNAGWLAGSSYNVAETGASCWNYKAYNTVAWAGSAGLSTATTDYETPAMGTFTTASTDAVGKEYTCALSTSRVAGWFGASNTNYGIVIKGSTTSTVYIDLAENSTPGYRPKLVVNYTEASAPVALIIADAAHVQTADAPTPTYHAASYTLTIQDTAHAQAVDQLALTYHPAQYSLVVQDAAHGHSADQAALTYHPAAYTLTVQDATHAHTEDGPALVYHPAQYTLAIQDAAHAHAADQPALDYHAPGAVMLVIANAEHAQAAGGLELVQHSILSIQGGAHGQAADSLTLTAYAPGGAVLTIQDAVHDHSAGLVSLVQHHILGISDAHQDQAADSVTLVLPAAFGQVAISAALAYTIGLGAGTVTALAIAADLANRLSASAELENSLDISLALTNRLAIEEA